MYYATEKELEILDDLAVENGLEVRQMMELAGFHMVEVFRKMNIAKDLKIVVVCGKGNKAGDGLCAVRHLINHGWKNIHVVLLSGKLKEDPEHHLQLLKKMKVPVSVYPGGKEQMTLADIMIDSLIGYHLKGAPRGVFVEVINLMNESDAEVVAYDIPSGIDVTTGECHDPCVKADVTLTLGLPKKAFLQKEAKKRCGKILLGDIGVPEFIYDQVSKGSKPPFKKSSVLHLFSHS